MGLKENMQQELVRDLSIRDAIVVTADSPIREAIALMRAKQLGCAIVVDPHGKPLGTFTERTMIDVMLRFPQEFMEQTVGEHVYTSAIFVKQSDPIHLVWDAIQNLGHRFIGVVDDQGKLIGLTGQKGMSEYIAEHCPQQVMVQRIGGKPGLQQREGA